MIYFTVEELFPPEMIPSNGLLNLLDSRLVDTIDNIRKTLGYKMIINNWKWQKDNPYKYRGYRPQGCGVGVPNGAHYKGMAVDVDFYEGKDRINPKSVVIKLIRERDKFPHIRGLEVDVSWNHIDVMGDEITPRRHGVNDKNSKIMLFNDKGYVNII